MHLLAVAAEALCVQQCVCSYEHRLRAQVKGQRLVDPAQRLPQVCHEVNAGIAAQSKLHTEFCLNTVDVQLCPLQLLQQHH